MRTESPPRPQVMIAPNALKHSARAMPAAEAIRRGLMRSGLPADYHLFPLADGGDGTVQVLTRCLGGTFKSARVQDPLG
ncbi:MAG TPA: glycerate kinase, partial [Cytophagales bacterium]|nr:glycerate kinase [Cytophagales bacterium]